MKLNRKDLIVSLLAVSFGFAAGCFWCFRKHEPGVRVVAALVRWSQYALLAHDPVLSNSTSEDPIIVVSSDDPDEWHLRLMGKEVARSEQPIRDFLFMLRREVPNAHPYVRIVVDDNIRMGSVMDLLRLCRTCGFPDADLNGFAGHNYVWPEDDDRAR